jgi:hypothetical protein
MAMVKTIEHTHGCTNVAVGPPNEYTPLSESGVAFSVATVSMEAPLRLRKGAPERRAIRSHDMPGFNPDNIVNPTNTRKMQIST